ncbi:MAG: cytidylate kinase family protein [Nitrospirae bacterium]|nr:cytidylate kinase family protein [Nitrospirota bacterium]
MAILTISREFGSGGREIGQTIAKLMNLEYISKEQIFNDIRSQGRNWKEYGKEFDEHCPSLWEKYDWPFRGLSALIQSHLLNHALKDNVVVIGRGGNFLLKGVPYALRIRVIAAMEDRIDRIMKRDEVDRDTARRLAEKTDRERDCFIHLAYGKHWDDPAEYDMVFDTSAKTIDEITTIVKDALKNREGLKTEEAKKNLKMHALAATVKAGILTDPSFFVPTLDVQHDAASITLRGVIHNPKEHKRIEDIAKKLAGGVPVKCELHYRG